MQCINCGSTKWDEIPQTDQNVKVVADGKAVLVCEGPACDMVLMKSDCGAWMAPVWRRRVVARLWIIPIRRGRRYIARWSCTHCSERVENDPPRDESTAGEADA